MNPTKNRGPRKSIAALVAAACSILAIGAGASAALAHVDVVATSPKRNAQLAKAPRAVTVTFSAQTLRGTIAVKNGQGRVVSTKGGRDPGDVRRLRVTLRPGLGKGAYVVRWTAVAPDGDEATGSFRFTVR